MLASAAALFAALWILLGLSILASDMRAHRRAGPLVRRPTRIADLVDGTPAKLVGRLHLGDETLRAPLSGRECAAYEVRVDRRRRLRWRECERRRGQSGFYVDDGSGEVFVPVDGPLRLQLEVDSRYWSGKRATRALARFIGVLAKADPKARFRCDEATLGEGAKVAIYGSFRRQPARHENGERPYRERAFEFVAEPADGAIHISDARAALG